MANSKSSKKRKQAQRRRQAQHRQAHAVDKARDRDGSHEHLPKTGTPTDHGYLYRRGIEDTVDFGLTKAKTGVLNWVIALVVVLVLAAMIAFFVTR